MSAIILPVFLFTLSMTITPGPNNMLLTASGARFGYRRTLPLIGGIVLGIISQLVLSALGLGVLFQSIPVLKGLLKVFGVLYLVYLAYRIAFTPGKKKYGKEAEQPLGLMAGAGFQYLNPKAYIMSITAMSVYPVQGELFLPSALLIIAFFLVITPLAISVWAGFGTLLGRLMSSARYARGVRMLLGGMTAASVVFILI
ncbi:LysE family translocator [Marispirochaeta aestuarii]|uniref:LysE family translocator n=1 Tax=Marispirochaeta aestuarii TaxID=1963862 RepID=UPI0029C7B8F0|nr:LysE family translocator [Marispirochaeta aestuarii]